MPEAVNGRGVDTLVVGAGIVGIATAYYLKQRRPQSSVLLVDRGQPMALTSAQSGENYRNWWPHPIMTAFTDRSIDLMEALARESGDRFIMSRRGYALATRAGDVDDLLTALVAGYREAPDGEIRVHDARVSKTYKAATHADWTAAPGGVDVLRNSTLIQQAFPSLDKEVRNIVHIRRAGAISAQQLGQYLLERFRETGGQRLTGRVVAIEADDGFRVQLGAGDDEADERGVTTIRAERLVNAAGPFIDEIARMLDTSLPVKNILQQKIAFEDRNSAIPRRLPFAIDLDHQMIDWTADERDQLIADPDYAWLAEDMPGAIHCRPDGGDEGTWVKLGWAFNQAAESARLAPVLDDTFPEIVLRGAARLNPSLKAYYGKLPRHRYHYGGYYTMTDENWPLIGEMAVAGSYVVGAMSGFGTMAACAAGELCARWVTDQELPPFAAALSPDRYADTALMAEINTLASRGIL